MKRNPTQPSAPHGLKRVRASIRLAPFRVIIVSLLAAAMSLVGLVVGPASLAGAATSNETQVVGGVNNPSAVVVDGAGNLFITNSGANAIIVVAKTTGTIFGQSVTANTPVKLSAATGLSYPNDLAFDASGNLYATNFGNGTVTVIPSQSGTLFGQSVTVNTAATLTAATGLTNPIGLAFDGAGDLFVTNVGHVSVVPVATSTIFGQSFAIDTAATLTASNAFSATFGLAFDAHNNLYYASNGAVAVVPASTSTIFGQSYTINTPALLTAFGNTVGTQGLTFDGAGNLYVVNNSTVTVVPAASGTLFGQTVTVNSGAALTAVSGLNSAQDISFNAGNLYVGNFYGEVITVISGSTGTLFGQSVTTNTSATLAVSAAVNQPQGLAFDSAGDLFIANYGKNTVTVIAKSSGVIFDQAVTANVPTRLTAATGLSQPSALAFDANGDLFISDYGSSRVSVVPKSSGTIFGQTVIADSAAILTASAGLQQPTGLAFDANGDLFLTNSDNYLTVIPATTSTVFGQSMTANVMVGLTISNSALLQPGEIAFDGHGNLYVANVAGNTVTVIPASSGTLFGQSVTADTVATLAAATGLHNPTGLALDAAGNLYVTNAGTSTVSVLARANTTLFGQLVSSNTTTTLTAFSLLANPAGLAFDANGDLYASDLGGVAFITAPATLVQGSPTVATIANNQGYAGALSVSNAVGPVTYVESASTYSSAIVVNSAGTITYPASTLTAGTYTVSGTDSDTNAPSGLGTWSFTLTVASPIAPPTGSPAPPPTSPTIPASTFGTPITVTDSNTLPLTIMSPTGGASESITVPVNALPSGTNVSIYPVTSNAPLVLLVPKGSTYVLSFGVSWETPAGSTPPTIVPIDATITDPTIVPGDTIYEVAPTGLVALGTASSAGTLSFTFSNDPTFLITHATVVPQGSPHATRVLGSAHVGKTVTLAIAGNHFYGQPSVTSDEAGTKAVVTHDTGTLLTLRVTVRRSSRVGEHTFTIRLANGASFKVRYSVK